MGRTPSRWPQLAAAGCWGALLALGAGLALLLLADPWCENRVLADVAAPSGGQRAVVVARDCGRPAGVSTQVSVRPAWMPAWLRARGGGNVLALDRGDAGRGRAPAGPGGGPRVAARWLGPRVLEVRYDARARELGARPPTDGETEVRFVADST